MTLPARMGKVGDEADPQWFLGDGEDDGNGSGRLLYCSDCAPIATMTSTFCRTNSAAISATRSGRPF